RTILPVASIQMVSDRAVKLAVEFIVRIRFKNFTPSLAFIKEIIGGGTPSLARQGLASIATILLNVAAGAYGDAAIAGMSIVTRIAMFINAFLIGFG
ncbi:hypothetical protein PZH42_31150, partial [Bacteroides cellulosilyticus]|nr:hypothetical protein [Bacteroides cellulosilyticus]